MSSLVPLSGVIFDRDGVLIEDRHFMFQPELISWIPGAVSLIRLLNSRGVKVLVASNQSGVARGLFSEDQVSVFHAEMRRQLAGQGAYIDAIAYCPHHPDATVQRYRAVCACRKPAAGLLHDLMLTYGLDKPVTLMVGDRESDMGAAANAGVAGLLFRGGDLLQAFTQAGHLARLPEAAEAAKPASRAADCWS